MEHVRSYGFQTRLDPETKDVKTVLCITGAFGSRLLVDESKVWVDPETSAFPCIERSALNDANLQISIHEGSRFLYWVREGSESRSFAWADEGMLESALFRKFIELFNKRVLQARGRTRLP